VVQLLNLSSRESLYAYSKRRDFPEPLRYGKENRFKCREVIKWAKEHRADLEEEREKNKRLTAQETAKLIGWPIQKLDIAMKQGTAPPYRVNGLEVHWIKSEVLAWKEEQGSR
jgi:predicted DNA-binding transcriptional regulator AlpA